MRRLEERRVLSVDVVSGQTLSVAENSPANTVVGTPVVIQDELARPLTYSITAGNESNAFLINPVSGEIRVANSSQLDFETHPNWQLTIEAFATDDPTQGDVATVTVALADISGPAVANFGGAATLSACGPELSLTSDAGSTIWTAGREDVTSLTIVGSSSADTLTIDFTGGNPIPAGGVYYDGLSQPTGTVDALIFCGEIDTARYRYDDGHNGGIVVTDGGATGAIEYRNLEPLVNTGTAANLVFALGPGNDNVVLEEVAAGTLRLRSTDPVPTFETTTFAAPTTSLTLLTGDGDDKIIIAPLSGAFSLAVDGQAGTNTLVVDQLDAAPTAPSFTFAGFDFQQTATPDQAAALTGSLDGGYGVVMSALPGSLINISGFPDAAAGFDTALSLGRLLNPSLSTGTLGVNLPSSNVGSAVRSGVVVSWSGGRELTEQDGDDFVIYESSTSANGPDAAMIQVHIVGVGWTKWRYEAPDSRAAYGGSGGAGAFATSFDLADFGLAAGQSIDAIRYVNMTAADRMEGSGVERVSGDGVYVASGFVIPGDNGATSIVLPDPGSFASFAYYGNATFDPDPLYFGALHQLATAGGSDSADIVGVTHSTITASRNGTGAPTIGYSSFAALEINTHDSVDQITIDVSAGLPATLRVDAGSPTSQDSLTVRGTTGAQGFALAGDSIIVGGTTLRTAGVESLTIDLSAAGTGDTVSLDRSFALSGGAPKLRVVGGGAADQDRLFVDAEFPDSLATAAQNFAFAGVTFNQASTPNLLSELGSGPLDGGYGAAITTRPLSSGPSSGAITGFPDSTVDFDGSLSLGALWERATSATARFVNLPDGSNDGTAARAGLALGWGEGRTLSNGLGTDFVVYESGADGGGPDAYMVQVRNADTGVWSQWVYLKASASANYGGAVAFATSFDLAANFGITGAVNAIRIANLTAADRVVNASGEGVVVIGGGAGTFQPLDPSNAPFGAGGFDPDLLYFGAVHALDSVSSGNDVVAVDSDSVDVAGYLAIGHSGLVDVTVDTGGGADSIRVTPSADTAITVRADAPGIGVNPGDRLVLELAGVATPLFTSIGIGAGAFSSGNRANVTIEGIDSLGATSRMDVAVSEAAHSTAGSVDTFGIVRNGASNEIGVNGQIVLRVDREAIEKLEIVGSDAADDQLTVDFAGGSPIPATGLEFAAGVGGDDSLRYTGGTVTTVVQTFDNAIDGRTSIDGEVVEYTGLEGIVDDLTSANRQFVYLATANAIELGDDTSSAGRSRISGDHGAPTNFQNPTGALLLDAGPNDDVVTLGRLDATFAASVTIRGGAGNDDIALDDNGRATAGGSVDWLTFPLTIDGGGQEEDRLTIDDTGSTRDKTYTVSNVQIGGGAVPLGAAVATPAGAPNVNGVIDGTEWDQVPYAFDSGPRPAANQQSILHFTFAEGSGATTADTTSNGNDGLLVTPTGPQFRPNAGQFGGALEFNGTTDYAWFQDASFNVGAQGTLSFWVKMDDVNRRNQFFEGPGNLGLEFQYRETGSGASKGQFYGSPNHAMIGNADDFAILSGGAAALAGTWANVTYTWQKTGATTGAMHLYVNGSEVTYLAGSDFTITNWSTVAATAQAFVTVGRDPSLSPTQSGAARYFDGMMDDVAWFDVALNATQRAAVYQAGAVPVVHSIEQIQATLGHDQVFDAKAANPASGRLVAYWSMDDAVGTSVAAGDGGTTVALHTTPSGAEAQFLPTGGKFGGALDFTNAESFATFQDPTFDISSQGSVSLWLYMRDGLRRNELFEGPNNSGFEFQYRDNSSGQFYGYVSRATGNSDDPTIQSGNSRNNVGAWHNVIYTWQRTSATAGEIHIYIDGVEVAYTSNNTTVTGWNNVVSTVDGLIKMGGDQGATTPDRWLDAKVDDVAWFDRVLSASQRAALQTSSVDGIQATVGHDAFFDAKAVNAANGRLLAYWNFDNPLGTTVVAGNGGTNITLRLNVPPMPEGVAFDAVGGPVLPGSGTKLNAGVFDGNGDFIRVADSSSLDFDKNKGTISFWVNPQAHAVDNNLATGYAALVEDTKQQIFVGISYQQDAGAALGNADFYNRLVFSPYQNTPGANQNIVVSNTRLTPGQWTHVTVTWDYATHSALIYINGALDATIVNNTTSGAVWTQAAGDTGDWIFGADGKTQAHGFTGSIADLAVYGSALRASEVQSVYRTGAPNSGSFDLAGAKGRFTWDGNYLYGLIESYPAGADDSNGPFDNLELDLYINGRSTLAARLDASVLVPVNNVAASTVLPAGDDVVRYEFRIPLAAIDDGVTAFDPTAGDYLRYHLRTIDGEVAGSGFDTRDTTLGWVVEPPLTSDGLRRLEFARSENFFGVGGRLDYANFAHLTINAGDGRDQLTVVDSQHAPAATNPTKTFTLNMGGGDDQVTIAAVDSAFHAAVYIDGQGCDDTVTVDAALNLGSVLSNGNLNMTAETIAVNAPIDTTAGTVGDVTLHVGKSLTIADLGNIAAGGDVLIDGAGSTSTAADITTAGGGITIETATTLADANTLTSAGGDIAFSGLAATLDGPYNFTINAGTGNVRFDGVVGGASPLTALIDVVLTSAHDLSINRDFSARSLTHAAGTGTTTVDGVVTLSEAAATALTIDTPTIDVNAAINTAGGTVELTVDNLQVAAPLAVNGVGGRLMTIVERTAGRELELGGNAVSRLALDAGELALLTARTLRFGDAAAGDLHLTAPVGTVPGVTNFHWITSGGVSGPGSVTATNLGVEAVGDVRLDNAANDVVLLAIHTIGVGSDISYCDANDFRLDDVDGVGGIATSGDVTLRTPTQITQGLFGSIAAAGLQLLGGSAVLDLQINDIDVLAADLNDVLDFADGDDLRVGTVQTFGPATVGVTTTDDAVMLFAGQTLSLQNAVIVGNAQVILVSDHGAIDDVGSVGVKVQAAELALRADGGIGVTQALRTQIGIFAAVNAGSGGIRVDDVSGALLTVGTVVGPSFSTSGIANFGLDGSVLSHVGALRIAQPILDAGGGITLSTIADGGNDDDLTVDAPIILGPSGGGDISFAASTDLLVNDTGAADDIRNFGSGSIVGGAGREVLLGPDVLIRSLTGAITGIPPLLQNLTGPQIANSGDASLTFDYGRLLEFNFTAVVDWSDGVVDTLILSAPGTTTAAHNYTGNPNVADPAAPIPVSVVLRSDSLIRFTGYETSTLQILLTFPGDGVRNVRIDTTVQVRHLTADQPQRLTIDAPQVAPAQGRSNVYGSGNSAQQTTATAERVVILREVLPDGREGSSVRFPQNALDDLPALFKKLRNGRYRVYLFEPETQTQRLVLEVDVREGKPAAPTSVEESMPDAGDQAVSAPPEDFDAAAIQIESEDGTPDGVLPATTAALAVGLAVIGDGKCSSRADAALARFRKYSRLRPPPNPRRRFPR
ncbi:MAG: cadherin domain-containing protein [Planctomycetaceae bacterium]|nr:cadherin domain-containing protein [Planctomycetaceae bacterium]